MSEEKRYNVSIETRNSVKYYSMTESEYDDLMYAVESGNSQFVKIPGSNLFVNVNQIVYIYAKEIKSSVEI